MPTLRVRAFNGPADFAVPRGTKIIHGDSHRGTILMACPDGPNVPHKLVAIQVSEETVTPLPEGTIEDSLYFHPWLVWLQP